LAKLSEGYTPYEIKASGEFNCTGEHNFEIKTTIYGNNEFSINIPPNLFAAIITDPTSLEFPSVHPSTKLIKSVHIIAKNSAINITAMQTDNSLFQIESTERPLPI
jgi:hypothetical protein